MSDLRLGPVRISGSVLLALGIWCWLGGDTLVLLFLLSALLHELGHLAAAWALGVPVDCLRITWTGGELRTQGMQPPWVDGVVLLAGSAVNLLQGILCARLDRPILAGTAVVLGCFNLLPISPLDGGELLRLLAEELLSPLWAERVCSWTAWGLSGGLFLLGVWLWLGWGGTPVPMMFGAWLLVGCAGNRTEKKVYFGR